VDQQGMVAGPTSTQDATTLSATATTEILRRIESLELAPGAVLTERDLATALQMSKAPVREALQRLSGTGLVTPRHGSGYVVKPITLRGVSDLLDVWMLFEEGAVAAMQRRGSAAWSKDIREFKADLPPDPAEGQIILERVFHAHLVHESRNAYLFQLWLFPLSDVIRVLRFAGRLGQNIECGDEAHDALLDALRQGSPDAPALARRNVEALKARILDVLITAEGVQGLNLADS